MDGHVHDQQGDSGQVIAELGYTGGLPAELLVDIFSLLPFWDRVRTAIVCRRWRAVSLEAAGRLWSTLVAPGDVVAPHSVDACRGLLDRARPTLVSFTIPDMFAGNFKELGEMIVEHLPHIKALDITFPVHPFVSWEVSSELSNGVSSTLQNDSPVLERIRIANRAKVRIEGMSIVQGPALNYIELHGVDLFCLRKCSGSRALRTLIVDTHAMRWDRYSRFAWPLICSFSLLENLAVCIENAEIPDVSANRRPFPRTLKRVSLSLRPSTFAQLTTPEDFARLNAWQLAFINIASQQLADLADIMPYLQHVARAAVAGAVQFDGNGFHITLSASDGRHATVHGIKFDAAWSMPLSSVTRLCVGGLATLPGPAMQSSASFPVLEDLTFDVTPESSAFASTTFKWPRLTCPILRAVCVRSAAATRKIPLAAITSLLQESLTVPGKLAELNLHGVQVLVPQGVDAVAELHELAETVTILEADGVWPECYLSWNRPWHELVR